MSEATEKPTLVVDDALAKAVQAAVNPADIREAFIAEARKQGLAPNADGVVVPAVTDQTAIDKAAADKAAADKVVADAAAAKTVEPKTNEENTFKQTETINGREFEFEAASELELERMIANAYRVASAVKETQTVETTAVDPNQEAIDKAAAEAKAIAATELELKFKRGEISATDYIEQSGAIATYLEKQGLPIEALKASVEENANRKYEQSWVDAVEAFKNSAAGKDWPGGENNREILGLQLQALNLVDAEDKVAALSQAYSHMKARDMVVPPKASVSTDTSVADAAAAKAAADKVAADAVTAAAEKAKADAAAKTKSTSSSVFGASSGVSALSTTPAAAAAAASKVELDPKASPEEILAAWKAGTVAAGKDPNAAFVEQFKSRR